MSPSAAGGGQTDPRGAAGLRVGCYDAPFADLPTYRQRLDALLDLGFQSVGLAVDWTDPPGAASAEDLGAMKRQLQTHGAELRLHPDLGRLQQQARQQGVDLLVHARRQAESLLEVAAELGAVSICCDSVRDDLDTTVALFRLLLDISAGTGLRLGVENSQRGVINSPQTMNDAVHRVGDERMGLLVDVGHINTTIGNGWNDCASPAEFLAGLRVPIWDTHLHNNDGKTDGHLSLRDAEGTLDLAVVVDGLRELGYDGPLQMECAPKNRQWTRQQAEQTLLDDRRYLEHLIAAG